MKLNGRIWAVFMWFRISFIDGLFVTLGHERSSFTKSDHFSFQVRHHNIVLHMVTHKKRL